VTDLEGLRRIREGVEGLLEERKTLMGLVKKLEEELECNGRVLHSMQTERDNALAMLGVYKIKNDELKGNK
jgi:hypothetical protein